MSYQYLVTGARGFVGSAIAARLHAEGAGVCGLCRRNSALEFPVTVLPDMADRAVLADQLAGVDVVIHCAARVHIMRDSVDNPLAEFLAVNRDLTESLARQAAEAGVKRFVFLSSIKVNGETTSGGDPFRPSDEPGPSDPYGISKKEAEDVLHEIARTTGMEVVIIRSPLVYGPGVKGNFESLLKLSDSGVPIPLKAVRNKRSMVFLGNLVDFVIHCSRAPLAANETFTISDGRDVSTAELVAMIREAMGRPHRLLPVPVVLFRLAGALTGKSAAFDRLVGSLQVDSSKASTVLGWAPPYSVEQGIAATVDDFQR